MTIDRTVLRAIDHCLRYFTAMPRPVVLMLFQSRIAG